MEELVIDRRHRGPARSGNGGYVSGLVAEPLGAGPTRVTLHVPPPLERPLVRRAHGDQVVLVDGDTTVATAESQASAELAEVSPVDLAKARAASPGYPGHAFHPFPTCFACGTQNPGGLWIFPGPVAPAHDGRVRVAAPWTPPEDVDRPTVWAALDCVGGWAGDLTDRLMVLGRMTARVEQVPAPGEDCVVMGEAVGAEGRRTFTRSSIRTHEGVLVGLAEHVWVSVDPDRFNL